MAWSTDFPHHGNDWPYSRKVIETLFVNVPEEERHKIVCGNAKRFWNLGS
jgi:predicted TIM-barrel fold metal-dependent hydrolase